MLKLVKKPTVIVPVSISPDSKIFRQTKDKLIEVKEKFNMPIPTHIHFYLTAELIEKMKNLKAVLQEYNLSELNFISSTIKDKEHSYVELYVEDKPLISSIYNECNKKNYTFEDKHFMINLNKSRNCSFKASFLYNNENSYFEFYSQCFDVI